MPDNLEKVISDFNSELEKVDSIAELMNIKSRVLGKSGHLSELMASLRDKSPAEKKELGAKFNSCKKDFEEKISQKREALESQKLQKDEASSWVDTSLRESNLDLGIGVAGYHPTSMVQREIEEIFISMGFEILDGPHIETDYYNFQALNIPADHPARDMQDTFWFPDKLHLLRTQTSAVQVRGMEVYRPPFKFVAPGTCFRCERTDVGHEMVFNQLEGMMVGEGVSVSHLIYFMTTLLREVFRKEVTIRLRPGFFPFVEPGFELDISCLICGGKGCPVCKNSGWVELLPCGMVHPAVLRYGKIDPEVHSGFAFGLGLDRLVMMRYAISDIRLLHSGDLRFVKQFGAY